MSTRRRLVVAITSIAAASAMLLTGCSASGSGSTPQPTKSVAAAADISKCKVPSTPIQVTFGQQASQAMTVATTALEKKYPGLQFDAQPQATTSYDDLTKQIVGDIAVGKRPDVIMTGLGQLRFWVDTYKPTPIDPNALPSSYQKQFLSAGTVDGTPYLAPGQISAPVLLVNTTLTKQAGVDASKITSLAELESAAQKVTDKTGKASVSIPTVGLPDWFTQAFTQEAGEKFVNDNGTAGFGTPTAIKALSIWQDLGSKKLEAGLQDQDALTAFMGGQLPFLVYTTSVIASVQKAVGDKFSWAAQDLPTLSGTAKGPLPAGGNGWIVLSTDKCRAAFSNALVGELLSPAAVLAASGTAYSYIPVDKNAAKQLLSSSSVTPQLKYAWSYSKPLSQWDGFEGKYTVQINDQIRTMTQKLQSGADTKSTVAATVTSINQILGKK